MTTSAEDAIETHIGDLHIEASGELAEAFVDSVERPSHLARCRECGAKVTYRPTTSGAGFTIIKHSQPDPETTFGISASGLPMCPDGHGETETADDQIPVADAFEHVAELLGDGEAVQRSLPGIVPEFNWQGAYLELESKAVEVDADHRQWQEDAETAKESKKRWEKSAETFQRPVKRAARRVVDATTGSLPVEIVQVLQARGPVAPGVLVTKTRTTNYYIQKFVKAGLLVSTGKTTARLISLPGQAPPAKEEP